jgi:hypothetical protein
MWSFSRSLDICVLMLDIPGLINFDRICWIIICVRNKFRAKTEFTRLSLPCKIGAVEENYVV